MARADSRLGTWQVLLTITMVIIPLSAHGRHSLARRHHHHNQSSINKEALNTRMTSLRRTHLWGRSSLPEGQVQTSPETLYPDDVITVEFHSPAPDIVPSDVALDWAKAPKPQKQKGGDPTAWTLSDFYDYLSPDDDLSAVDATPEPEPTPSPPADMEDENPLLAGSPAVPENVKPNVDSGPSLAAPPMPGLEKGDGLGLGGAMGTDGCRLGYVRSGPGVCVSQCDIEPNFCFNGGVCTVIAGMGAFCRCNVQDYIWNKGTRCDWAVTEFQVMCVVVGVASLVLILLFMIIVFFAKRLHRLKNENKRLRKRSKYRPQSTEPQTDGLSVSTTADGSQPNVRKLCDTPPPAPQAHTQNLAYYDNIICQDDPQKQEDPAKSPATQGRGDGVTIGLEVLLPKDAKLHAETNPPLQYDVFLYKVANNGHSPIKPPPTHNINSYSSSHPMPKSPKTPKSPKVPKSPKHAKEHPPSNREPLSGRHSSPGRHHSPGRHPSPCRHPSPSRHSAPECYSSPTCHPSSHHFSLPVQMHAHLLLHPASVT
ncbi:Chondroitin sulfate proteoglycan [Larimichthys crocea]|uniref:Chondroitin sulfate proteoglycan n=1 Tax=Larimichthys crocea TaxID=215358 RepID=A0A6G0HSM5_LARCR|nr:Chondroitin sulfate proteoglycan [Larimichthys crocea]